MNPLFLLMGLLALAYMGSLLAGDRRIRGFGLPSGVEYVGLGFALGPSALGFLDRSTLEPFDPIAHVALGWVALALGLSLGAGVRHTPRLARKGRFVFLASLVCVASVGCTALIATPMYFALGRWSALAARERLLLSVLAGLACSETTRESVRWVTERYKASGKVSDAVANLAEGDDVVPLVLLAVCFAVGVPEELRWHPTIASCAIGTLGLGVVFGALSALLMAREIHADETWGTLLGFAVLGIGVVNRLGLSAISAMFMMGLTLALCSRHRHALLAMVTPTERTVLHPALLLAGARIDVHPSGIPLGLLVVLVLVARILAKGATSSVWQLASKDARKAGPLLGFGLLSAGTLSMTIGLACSLRFPGPIGDTVLALAAASATFGEIVGPFALRSSLRAAGDIAVTAPAPLQEEAAR